jgi:hypothetical protein
MPCARSKAQTRQRNGGDLPVFSQMAIAPQMAIATPSLATATDVHRTVDPGIKKAALAMLGIPVRID